MEEFFYVDGKRIPLPIGIRPQDDTKYCSECYDGANEVFTLVEGSTDAWCMKCLKDVKICTSCGAPKYFYHYHSEWGDYICEKCERLAKQEFEKRMVEGAKRAKQKAEAAMQIANGGYEGPAIMSFAKATDIYLSEIINRTETSKARSERYCENNQLNVGVLTMLQFASIITGIDGVNMTTVELVKHLAKMADVDEAVDYIMNKQRIQSYKLLKFKKLDHDNLTELGLTHSRYYERMKSKQQYYIGHKYDETTG